MAIEDLQRFLDRSRRAVIRCALPAGEETWQCDPFPGSEIARQLGCTCPFDQPWPGAYLFALDCPVHELAPGAAPES